MNQEENKKEITKQKKSISDRNFYTLFKPIRNKFRTYDPVSILSTSLGRLLHKEHVFLDQLRKQPWIHLVLLKWVFMDDSVALSGRPKITDREFDLLLDRVYKLSWTCRKPNQYEDITLFLRAMAAQQFLYQHSIKLDSLARQHELFLNVDSYHFFQTAFYNSTGLSLSSFLHLSLSLMSHFLDEESSPFITRDFFSSIEHEIDSEHVDAFLKVISKNIRDLPDALRTLDSKGRRPEEFIEETPFLAFPLINNNNAYCCVYPQILASNLGHFIFDTLKKADLSKFTLHFGRRFESYVAKLITESNLTFFDEDFLKVKLAEPGNLVDFLIVENDTNIFIEAKGVEMAARGKATHLKHVVHGAATSSLIKAIKQAHALNKRISEKHISANIRTRRETYLIVVTYKELYIGNGNALCRAVGKESLDRIYDLYAEELQIPLSKMYFLTIDELEKLLQLVKEGLIDLTTALKRAEQSDKHIESQKFMFSQHLSEWPESINMPSPHAENFTPIIDNLINMLK